MFRFFCPSSDLVRFHPTFWFGRLFPCRVRRRTVTEMKNLARFLVVVVQERFGVNRKSHKIWQPGWPILLQEQIRVSSKIIHFQSIATPCNHKSLFTRKHTYTRNNTQYHLKWQGDHHPRPLVILFPKRKRANKMTYWDHLEVPRSILMTNDHLQCTHLHLNPSWAVLLSTALMTWSASMEA